MKPEGALAAYFVRSPHAFATIEHIDVAAARSAPSVVAVLTAADLAEAQYHSISHPHPMPGRGGKVAASPTPALAGGKTRDACRRAGGDGGRGERAGGTGRRRKDRSRLPAARAGDRYTRGNRARRAATMAGSARQYRLRLDRAGRSRRQEAGRARSRLQGRGPCSACRTGQSASGGRLARAAHGDRELRRRQEPVHSALRHAGCRRRARPNRRRHGHQARGVARPHRGSRRRLRHEGAGAIPNTFRCCTPRAS